jgi:hypothetical protein
MRPTWRPLVCALFVGLYSSNANATHKSWNLIDPGANCHSSFAGPTATKFVYADGAITNTGSTLATVACPVTLAGRFGSLSGPSFSMQRWPTARKGIVYGYDGSSSGDIACQMIMFSDTGSVYNSAKVTASPAGANGQAVQVSVVQGGLSMSGGNWGGAIGRGLTLSVRSMEYYCDVPAGSSIYAYGEAICQWPDAAAPNGCWGNDGTPIGANTVTSVQDSGFVCLLDSSNPQASIWRNGVGLQNSGANAINVYCPLSKTSGDSGGEGTITINQVELYSTGDVPTNCKLSCRSEMTGSVNYSSAFLSDTSNWVDPTNPYHPPAVLKKKAYSVCLGALGVSCSLPSQTTILGFLHTDVVPGLDLGI